MRIERVLVPVLLIGIACARAVGPPPIPADAACARCGMDTGLRRFACERVVNGTWRVYDSIECLRGDAAQAEATTVWLADYDRGTLHRADSMWIVQGGITTPMGGGLAAFLDRAAADTVAGAGRGIVTRWDRLTTPAAGAR